MMMVAALPTLLGRRSSLMGHALHMARFDTVRCGTEKVVGCYVSLLSCILISPSQLLSARYATLGIRARIPVGD
jgi:hypothetical protein